MTDHALILGGWAKKEVYGLEVGIAKSPTRCQRPRDRERKIESEIPKVANDVDEA